MAVSAAIKYTQGLNAGSGGQALVGETGTQVDIENDDNTNVVNWVVTLLSVPYDSAVSPGILASGSDGTPLASFTPDVEGSYAVQLEVDNDGVDIAIDQRVFAVPYGANEWIIPAFGLDAQYVLSAHNFGGQPRGWAGTSSPKLLDAILREIHDSLGGSGNATSIQGVPIDATAPNDTEALVYDQALGKWKPAPSAGGGGGGYTTIQEDGGALTQRSTLDFVGSFFTASDTGSKTQVVATGNLGSTSLVTTGSIEGGTHLHITRSSLDTTASLAQLRKDRGGGIVGSSDSIGAYSFRPHDGAGYQITAQMLASVNGAPSAGNIPTRVRHMVGASTAGLATYLQADSGGGTTLTSPGSGAALTLGAVSLAASFNSPLSVVDSYDVTRSTADVTPTLLTLQKIRPGSAKVETGDSLGAIRFRGWDGSTYQNTGRIEVDVNSGTGAGFVNSRMRLQVGNSSAGLATFLVADAGATNGVSLISPVDPNVFIQLAPDDGIYLGANAWGISCGASSFWLGVGGLTVFDIANVSSLRSLGLFGSPTNWNGAQNTVFLRTSTAPSASDAQGAFLWALGGTDRELRTHRFRATEYLAGASLRLGDSAANATIMHWNGSFSAEGIVLNHTAGGFVNVAIFGTGIPSSWNSAEGILAIGNAEVVPTGPDTNAAFLWSVPNGAASELRTHQLRGTESIAYGTAVTQRNETYTAKNTGIADSATQILVSIAAVTLLGNDANVDVAANVQVRSTALGGYAIVTVVASFQIVGGTVTQIQTTDVVRVKEVNITHGTHFNVTIDRLAGAIRVSIQNLSGGPIDASTSVALAGTDW